MLYMAQGEENMDNTTMGCVVAINLKGAKGDITDSKIHLMWMQKSAVCGKSSPLLVDGRLYCIDDSSNLFILDAATGKPVTAKPTKLVGALTRGSPLYADGKIYMATTAGLQILKPTPEGVKFLVKARLDTKDDVSASMVVSHGRIYLQTALALYCLGTPDQKPASAGIPYPVPEPTGIKHLRICR